MTVQLKLNQQLKVRIKRLGINGEGITNYKGRILFVPNALPKEEVLVKVVTNSPKFTIAEIVKILKKSPQRVTPPCPVYETCGGCQLQHLDYPAQLDFKKDLLKQSLEKFRPENYREYPLPDTIGMENPWHYRNKAQFQLGIDRGKVIAGLYQEGTHRLVPIKNCLVQKEETQKIISSAVKLLNKFRLSIYNERKKSGFLRTLVTRFSFKTGEAQLVFVATSEKFPHKEEILRELLLLHPELKSITLNIHKTNSSLIFGDKTKLLYGKKSIEEHINGVVFDLSTRAFFQLNPIQTSVLYKETLKALNAEANETVVDAYCGVGTIGLSLAKKVQAVRGMDIVPEAIIDAQKNATRMNQTNCHYFVGRAENLLPKWVNEGFQPTSIVVDPPRSGLDEKLIKAIIQSSAQKLIYVSCNPSTLARDIVTLSKHFRVDYLQSIDMFPMTARCEVVGRLIRKN